MLAGVTFGVTALLTVLGWLPLITLGLGRRTALLFAPPVGLGVLGLLTLVNGLVGLPWTWWQVGVTLLILCIIAAVAVRKRPGAEAKTWAPAVSRRTLVYLAVGVTVFALFQGAALYKVMASADAIQSFGDAQFHYSGVQLVLDGASTSPFGGLAGLYSPGGERSVYYPTLWHSLVALFAFNDQIVLASNAALLATNLVFWPASLGLLAYVIAPKIRYSTLIAPILAIMCTIFPGNLVFQIAIHPLGLGLALLPGAIAVLLLLVTHPRSPAVYVIATLASVGMFTAHPSVGLLLAVAIGVTVLVALGIATAKLWTRGSRVGSVVLALASAGAVGMVFAQVMTSGYVRNLGSFGRGSRSYAEVLTAMVTGSLASAASTTNGRLAVLWILLFALALYGFWVTRSSKRAWVLMGSGAVYALLYVLAGGPEVALRALTGPWWKDDTRLLVPFLVVAMVFASVGAARAALQLWGAVRRKPYLIAATGVVAVVFTYLVVMPSAVLSWRTLIGYTTVGYSLESGSPSVLDEDKIAVLEVASDEFAPGELLVGPYTSGVGFVSSFGEMSSFYPKPRYDTAEQRLLALEFDQILSDPEVCEVVDQYNIVGLILDTPPEGLLDEEYSGFYDTDVTEGFELVTRSGGVSLWRITACD